MGSAFLTVWLRPGDTIEAILTRSAPIRLSLLLFALAGSAAAILQASLAGLQRPAELAVFAVLGAPLGIVDLYVSAPALWCIFRLFGGRAPNQAIRTALAFGAIPSVAALAPLLILILAPTQKLLLLPAILLMLWSWGTTIGMLGRIEGFSRGRTILVYLVGILLLTIAPVTLLRAFLYEPFRVASNSMEPSLLKGDSVIVAKYAYGFSRYSLPKDLRLISGRLFARDPRRGDLVVLRLPADPRQSYLKRVIGLPGDHIQISHRVLSINGQAAALDEQGMTASHLLRFRETLADGRSYEVQAAGDAADAPPENTQEVIVPDGQCFVLGDNRDNSLDSRFEQIGFIPLDNVFGRVVRVIYSVGGDGGLIWDRIWAAPQ